MVQAAIEARLADEAISVRDAVLELLGKCGGQTILLLPPLTIRGNETPVSDASLLEPYKQMILERTNDQGLAVRKRAVKLVRDTMLK